MCVIRFDLIWLQQNYTSLYWSVALGFIDLFFFNFLFCTQCFTVHNAQMTSRCDIKIVRRVLARALIMKSSKNKPLRILGPKEFFAANLVHH